MSGGAKVARDFVVAGVARLGTGELRAGNAGRRDNRARARAAGHQDDGGRGAAAGEPKPIRAVRKKSSSCAQSPHNRSLGTQSEHDYAFLLKKNLPNELDLWRAVRRDIPLETDRSLS